MTIRKRNDAQGWKRGEGAYTGNDPEPTRNLYDADDAWSYRPSEAVDPWSYPGNREVPSDEDIKGRKVRNNPGEAAYSPDSDGESATRGKDDFQFWAQSRDIMADVEANQNPNGEFDATGPIKAGVNRAQDE